MSRSRYGNERETTSREDTRSSYGGRQDIRRDMRDPRDVRDPTRDMPRDPRDRDVDPRDPRYSTRSHEHDKRYYYEQRRKREWEMYHTRGGPHPEDPYRGYRDPRAYTGYGREVYDRRNYYADRLYDRSDEISISHSESVRSETVSHSVNNKYDRLSSWLSAHDSSSRRGSSSPRAPLIESHEPATSTDPLKESTDTDALISSSDSKCNLLDDSQDLGSEEDPSQIEESIEEEEVVEESTALADMYTEPYLYTQPHVRARCFGPNRFACVLPNDETDESAPHIVEISDFKLLYWQELKEIEEYPGPFIKGETPKRDVTNYCKKQASLLRKNNCFDEGKILLWELLALFCKQNGVVIGTDVAELLLADQETTTIYSTSQIGGFNKEGQAIAVTEEQKTEAIQQIRECLFEGQRKEALEVSVKYCLWELAFTISTTLSSDILSSTLQRFASSLHTDDPLKSFHQLISSTEPSACADVTKWRQHLAMLLSNQSDRYDPNFNYILTLANTLASASMVYASHFACLMSGSKLTSVLDKTSPLALLGLDHTKDSITRLPYAPIQLTEIYEYSKILGGEPCIVSFQGVKLYYAKEVAKVGHYSKSLQYLQQISNNINMAPKSYRARFIQRVYDECIKTVQLLGRSLPDWVEHLRETLKNRELGISNRSTAYSSRVATPDIQRVAQYLLHRQKPAAVTSQLVQESAHTAQNVQSQPQQQPVAQPHIDTHQAATSQSSEPVSEDTSQSLDPSSQSLDPSSQSLDATSGPVDPANQHQELLNNGYSWDGQLYRHESYPGYCLYEGQWYPDPHYQQPVEEQQDHVAHQQNHVTHQPSEQTETDGAGETSGVGQGKEGYSPTEYLTPRREPGTLEYPADNSYDEFRTPRATETSPQQDSLTEMNRDTYKQDAFSRHRQDTLTADDQIDTVDYNQSHGALPESTESTTDQSPAAPAFTFFNPAQFGGGSVSMLAPMVPLSGSSNPDQPLSEDEIKTPTNDEPKDPAGGPQKKKKQVLPGEEENAAPVKKEEPKKSSGIFSRLFKGSGNKRMILPDDSKPTIYWDENLGKYVDTSKESDEEDEAPPPPPTNSLPASLPPSSRSSLSGGSEEFPQSAPGSPGGSFRRKPGRGRLGGANRYVDVMAGSGMKKSATTPNFS